MSRRLFNFWVLPAMLSMCISAVAACACSHHAASQEQVESLSCHSASHAAPTDPAEGPEPTGDLAGADCECMVGKPVPAISAISGNKKAAAAEQALEPAPVFLLPEPEFVSLSIADRRPYLEAIANAPPLDSGHSRAPPRLLIRTNID